MLALVLVANPKLCPSPYIVSLELAFLPRWPLLLMTVLTLWRIEANIVDPLVSFHLQIYEELYSFFCTLNG